MKSMRDEFGDFLVDYGQEREELIVLDADLSTSTRTDKFAGKFPGRFFNLGIAEQNMVGIGIGLALGGKTVIISGFTIFTIGRAWDFIRAAAHDNVPVIICTTHSGLSPSQDGSSHQCLEDIALTCSIPGLKVLSPADARETRMCLKYAIDKKEPCFIRLLRNPGPPVIPEDYKFNFGSIQKIKQGKDASLFCLGSMTGIGLEAAKILENRGINIAVMNVSTVKPLEVATIIKEANMGQKIITLEDHNILTGLGSQITRIISSIHPVPVLCIGIEDQFGQSGEESELLDLYGLSGSKIASRIGEFLD